MGDKMKLKRLSKSIIFSNSKKEFALSRITKDTFIEAKLKKIDCRFIRLSLSFCDSLQCGKIEFIRVEKEGYHDHLKYICHFYCDSKKCIDSFVVSNKATQIKEGWFFYDY